MADICGSVSLFRFYIAYPVSGVTGSGERIKAVGVTGRITGNPGSNTVNADGKALTRFSTEGLRVCGVVLPTLFRRQSRFLIGLYVAARDCQCNVSLRHQFRFVHRLRI
jgi:hypothetical protein